MADVTGIECNIDDEMRKESSNQSDGRIGKGEEITHSYTEPLDPVLLRRTLLQVSSWQNQNYFSAFRFVDLFRWGSSFNALACGALTPLSSVPSPAPSHALNAGKGA